MFPDLMTWNWEAAHFGAVEMILKALTAVIPKVLSELSSVEMNWMPKIYVLIAILILECYIDFLEFFTLASLTCSLVDLHHCRRDNENIHIRFLHWIIILGLEFRDKS